MAFGAQKNASNRTLTAGTSHTANIPASVNGHGVFIWVGIPSTSDIINTPSGWTKIGTWAGATTRVSLFAIQGTLLGGATTQAFTSSSSTRACLETWAVEAASITPNEVVNDSGTGESWGPGAFSSAGFGIDYVSNCFGMYTYDSADYPLMGASDFDSDYPSIRRNLRVDADYCGSAHSSTNLTTSITPESTMGMSGTGTTTFEWVSVGFSVVEDSSPSQYVTSITGATTASGSGEASTIGSLDITSSTSATGGSYINPLTPETNDATASGQVVIKPVIDVHIQSFADASGSVVGKEIDNNLITSIEGTTEAFGAMAACPVSDLAFVAGVTSASGGATASPILQAIIGATTEASGEVLNPTPQLGAGCCCFVPTGGPECQGFVGFDSSRWSWGYNYNESDCYNWPVLVSFRATMFIWSNSGNVGGGKFTVKKNGQTIHEIEIGPNDWISYWWDGSGSPGDVIEVKWVGDCESSKTCTLYNPIIPSYTTCIGASGLCSNIYSSFLEYPFISASAPDHQCLANVAESSFGIIHPTASVTVSGLTGPLAALNGTYSGRMFLDCDTIRITICWAPENFELGFVPWTSGGFGYVFASLSVNFSVPGLAQLYQVAGWNHLRWNNETFGLDWDCNTYKDGNLFPNQPWQTSNDYNQQCVWRVIAGTNHLNPNSSKTVWFPVSSCDPQCELPIPTTDFNRISKSISKAVFPQFSQKTIEYLGTDCEECLPSSWDRTLDYCINDASIVWTYPQE